MAKPQGSEEKIRNALGDYFARVTDLALQISKSRIQKKLPEFARYINLRNAQFLHIIGDDIFFHRGLESETEISWNSDVHKFPQWTPLHYRYRKHKAKLFGTNERGRSWFFYYSGRLAEILNKKDPTIAWGRITGSQIRITLKNNTSPTEFVRNNQVIKQARRLNGRFASPDDLNYFELHFPVFPNLDKGNAPEWLLFNGNYREDDNALAKLMGYHRHSKNGRGPIYRPLIPPYLAWYYDVKIPQYTREFNWK